MKIKWCPEIFVKAHKSKCFICDNFTDHLKQCYGIFYIFHKIAQIRFIFIGLFERIKRFIQKIIDNNKLVNCLNCYCLIRNKWKKCPYCGANNDDIPFKRK